MDEANIELLQAQAQITAQADDRRTRKLLIFVLVGALIAVVGSIIGLAFYLGDSPDGLPGWLTGLIPITVQAVILGATSAWAYMLGSSSGSKAKDEKPAK